MSEISNGNSFLETLTGFELAAVTFVRDYIQLSFDIAHLTAYVWPKVLTSQQVFVEGDVGYRDALCGQIGKRVIRTLEAPSSKLTVAFSDESSIELSLREEDQCGPESATLRSASGDRMQVW